MAKQTHSFLFAKFILISPELSFVSPHYSWQSVHKLNTEFQLVPYQHCRKRVIACVSSRILHSYMLLWFAFWVASWHNWVAFSFMIYYKPKDLFWTTVILILYLVRKLFLLMCKTLPCLYWLILFTFLQDCFCQRKKKGVKRLWILIFIFSMPVNRHNFFLSTAYFMHVVFISPAKLLIETLHTTRDKIDPLRNYITKES